MTLAVYDFRSPAPMTGDLARRLENWFADTVRRTVKSWGKILNPPPELLATGNALIAFHDCPAYIAEESLCFRVALGLGDAVSLVVLPRPLMLALIGSALGETVTSLPADRELTAVEESLCEYLIRALLLDEFQGAWQGASPLKLDVRPRETDPRASLPFTPSDGVLACTFSVTGTFGAADWCWLLPRTEWLESLSAPAAAPRAEKVKPAEPHLEALARLMPVEIVVVLGTAEVALTQLKQLQPGDVIVLNQEIGQPMEALVSGAPKFRVFPGAMGWRQAVRVQSVMAG